MIAAMPEDQKTPEFSRPVVVDRLMTVAQTVAVEADANECAALAERFGLQAIRGLRGSVTFQGLSGGRRLKAQAHILADVVQSCVVTLDPVESAIDEHVELVFERVDENGSSAEVILNSLQDAEPLTSETLDVGELVATEMALALDPYPRAPGVDDIGPGAESDNMPKRPNPFEILGRLKGDK